MNVQLIRKKSINVRFKKTNQKYVDRNKQGPRKKNLI